ncbi:MAG TPA: hypothetical protein VHV57_08335 [Acidimicrobiales bacterium]|nr:hypothetical protein [Acidimicrobiales bacterium]
MTVPDVTSVAHPVADCRLARPAVPEQGHELARLHDEEDFEEKLRRLCVVSRSLGFERRDGRALTSGVGEIDMMNHDLDGTDGDGQSPGALAKVRLDIEDFEEALE